MSTIVKYSLFNIFFDHFTFLEDCAQFALHSFASLLRNWPNHNYQLGVKLWSQIAQDVDGGGLPRLRPSPPGKRVYRLRIANGDRFYFTKQ